MGPWGGWETQATFNGGDERAERIEAWEIAWRKAPAGPQGHGDQEVSRAQEGRVRAGSLQRNLLPRLVSVVFSSNPSDAFSVLHLLGDLSRLPFSLSETCY